MEPMSRTWVLRKLAAAGNKSAARQMHRLERRLGPLDPEWRAPASSNSGYSGGVRYFLVAAAVAIALVLLLRARDTIDHALVRSPAAVEEERQADKPPPPLEKPVETVKVKEPAKAAPDPIEKGDCTLFLRVVDEASGNPISTQVELWRLNAPENEHWTEGDQKQRDTLVPKEGVDIVDLPVGDYRVVVAGQRRASEDPQPFHVSGDRTLVCLSVPLPRSFRVFLKVLDENGIPLREGGLRTSQAWSGAAVAPSLVGVRRRKSPRDAGGHFSISGIGGATLTSRTRTRLGVRPGNDDRFDLGLVDESARKRGEGPATVNFILAGRTQVSVQVSSDEAGEKTYFGVSVPMEWIEALVFMPDGRSAKEAGGSFRASCAAIPVDGAPPFGWSRTLPIKVSVVLPGYKKLEFEYRISQPPAPLVLHVSQPLAAGG